jgi:hypothetical protein
MSSQRKKYVDHTVRCSGCGDVIIEVFAPMVSGEVVIGHRSLEWGAEVLSGGQPYKRARRRARDWKYTTHVHVVDSTGYAFYSPSSVSSACRCTYSRDFDVNELFARKGKSSTEAPHRRDWRDG